MAPVPPMNDSPSNHFMTSHMAAPSQGPNGIIMVDTMKLQPSRLNTKVPAVDSADPTNNTNSKKNRKNQRKNKAKDIPTAQAPPQLVTLRNPMFQPNGIPSPNVTFTPTALPPNIPMHIDQPAAIIKNNNGMFTIRNPALHEAMIQHLPNNPSAATTPSAYPVFPKHLPPPPILQPSVVPPPPTNTAPIGRHQDNYSFFSDHHQTDPLVQNKPPTQAIGSEIKQRMQQTAWPQQQNSAQLPTSTIGGLSNGGGSSTDLFNHLNNLNHQPPFARAPPSPYSFNSDFVGNTTNGMSSTPSPSFYNNGSTGGGSLGGNNNIDGNYSSYGNGSMSGGLNNGANMMGMGSATPPPVNNSYFYGNTAGAGTANKNFDDSSYLYNLQPGQRLNNEVNHTSLKD